MDQSRLAYLFDRFMQKKCSDAERREFFAILMNDTNREELENLLEKAVANSTGSEEMAQTKAQEIYEKIKQAAGITDKKVVSLFNWKRIAIAASVIFLLGFGIYFVIARREATKQSVPLATTQDIKPPQTNRATITTSDGKTIYLDSVSNGTLSTQNNVELIKTADGKINYELTANSQQPTAITYHTLNNPKGSKVVDITLSDGTKVWLNAASSITYPVAFVGNERKITMTGEAYFEVTHNAKMPFTVSANGVDVHDLGTSFNINAYDDENAVRVTLLQGSVVVTLHQAQGGKEVGSKKSEVKIVPGEQAVLTHGSQLTTNSSPDLEQVMAWKDDRFIFSGDNIESVMRQLARWYDVEVSYEGNIPNDEFVGVITRSRNENIKAILDMLEKTGTVSFTIEGRKVIVKPYK